MTLSIEYLASVFNSTLRCMTPILLVSLCAGVCSKVQVFNIALEGTLLSSSPADTYGTAYEMDCGRLQLSYCVFDDGTEYLFRMSTAVPYDQPDAVYTSRDFYCGYDEEHLTRAYIPAVTWDAFRSEEYDACYLYEPAGTRHIAFLLKDGVVAEIEMEDLMDGRLLPED